MQIKLNWKFSPQTFFVDRKMLHQSRQITLHRELLTKSWLKKSLSVNPIYLKENF
jgi:hypothetical protein